MIQPSASAQIVFTPDNPGSPVVHNSIGIGTAVTGGNVVGYDFFSAGGSSGVDLYVPPTFATIHAERARSVHLLRL